MKFKPLGFERLQVLDDLRDWAEGVPTRARPDVMGRIAGILEIDGKADLHSTRASEAVLDRIDGWMEDVTEAGLRRSVEALADLGERPCDPLTPVMLVRRGINPYALLLVEASHMGTTIPKNHTLIRKGERAFLEIIQPKGRRPGRLAWDHAKMALASGLWWDGRSVSTVGVPNTVAAVAKGMPLRAVISHPELDAIELAIDDIEVDSSGHATITTDRTVTPVAWINTLSAALGEACFQNQTEGART